MITLNHDQQRKIDDTIIIEDLYLMPGSPARNDLTTLLSTTFSALRLSYVPTIPPLLLSTRQGLWQASRYTEYPWIRKGVLGGLCTLLYYTMGTARAMRVWEIG